jgi:hypothetical protein
MLTPSKIYAVKTGQPRSAKIRKISLNLNKISHTITMITQPVFTQMALSFPGTEQVPHFERIGFKISGKRL